MLPKIVLPREGLQRKELDVDSDSDTSLEEENDSPKEIPSTAHKKFVTPQSRLHVKLPPLSQENQLSAREKAIPSSAKNKVIKSRPVSRYGRRNTTTRLSSTDSDTESESDNSSENLEEDIPLHLEEKLSEDILSLFPYIKKYTPKYIRLKTVYKPYIPTYTPAVGDVEAFLKIIPPDRENVVSEKVYENILNIGKNVVDEPAASQTDGDVFHIQLRTFGYQASEKKIKKVEGRPKKDCKIINKWITDVSSIHNNNLRSLMKFTNEIPNIREKVTNWSEKMEEILSVKGIPDPELQCSLEEYVEFMCMFFDIPIYENTVKSLHLLFSLYVALKETEIAEPEEYIDLPMPTLTKPLNPVVYQVNKYFSQYLQSRRSEPSKYHDM